MIDKVDHPNKVGNDFNGYLVSMWQALQQGWIPPTHICINTHTDMKNNIEQYPQRLVCFVGFLCSFGGKWFASYAKNAKGENYAERGHRVLLKQIDLIKDVEFRQGSYCSLELPPKSRIYCDPPYEGTGAYDAVSKFSHADFWEWVRNKTLEGHQVFISEYNAPADFICIWSKEINTTMSNNSNSIKRVERLFIWNGTKENRKKIRRYRHLNRTASL